MRPFGGRGTTIDWLIVGLGNPGREYSATPHNIGFRVADELARRWELRRGKDRFRGQLAEGRVLSQGPQLGGGAGDLAGGSPADPGGASSRPPRVALLWPQTYMNEAGRSVGPARGSFKVSLDRVLVIHDEIDLPFGEIRVRRGGGLAGHNGLKSIRHELGSPDFWRVRIGVGRPDSTDPEIVAAYVLGAFREPPAAVEGLIADGARAVEQTIRDADQPPAEASSR